MGHNASLQETTLCYEYKIDQNKPVMLPFSSTLIWCAAGTRGKPGIVMISPQITTKNSAEGFCELAETLLSAMAFRK